MKRTLIILAVMLITSVIGRAQQSEVKLNEEEKQEFAIKIQQKIEDFQTHLGIISSNRSNQRTKNEAIKECLKLFIGQGDRYTTYDVYDNPILNDAVCMQVSSKRNPHPVSKPMKVYLNTVATNLNNTYTKVKITSYDAVRVDNLHETGDGKYECVAYFFQKYEGYRNERLMYSDYTQKRVRVYLEQVEGPLGKTWSIMLGDISVVETR